MLKVCLYYLFRVEKEKEGLKAELQRMKQQAQESRAYIDAQEAEERKLLKVSIKRSKDISRLLSNTYIQGTHGTGKMAKKNPCQGKHREFGQFVTTQGKHREFCLNTGKTQGILLAQVVNVLILKVKDIAIVAANFSRTLIGLPSQFCVCNTHKLCKLAQGKFAVGQGKHREIENTI